MKTPPPFSDPKRLVRRAQHGVLRSDPFPKGEEKELPIPIHDGSRISLPFETGIPIGSRRKRRSVLIQDGSRISLPFDRIQVEEIMKLTTKSMDRRDGPSPFDDVALAEVEKRSATKDPRSACSRVRGRNLGTDVQF